MRKRGETQTGLHPSRDLDNKPIEYENTGSNEIYLKGGGYYRPEELTEATWYARESGPDEQKELRHHLEPAQGRLFDADAHEAKNRMALGAQRLQTATPEAAALRDRGLKASVIPSSHLQPRPGRFETHFIGGDDVANNAIGKTRGGYYDYARPGGVSDVVAAKGRETTVIHEMGHRKHLGEHDDPSSPLIHHPRGMHPDPLKEGVADAYVDRYGGRESHMHDRRMASRWSDDEPEEGVFGHYERSGYSTTYHNNLGPQWNDDERALYAATRAHASETGEQALYKPTELHEDEEPYMARSNKGHDPTIDATLVGLLEAGPHAKQALRQTGLKDVGAQAFRRHRDRQLLNQGQEVQGALFDEVVQKGRFRKGEKDKTLGYNPTPEAMPGDLDENLDKWSDSLLEFQDRADPGRTAWSEGMEKNQFGEEPRTKKDMRESLGVPEYKLKGKGF